MMTRVFALILAISVGSALQAAPLVGEKTYELLFRDGTLDSVDRASELVYHRKVTNALKPDAGKRDTGDIALSFRGGETNLAMLEFRQDGKHRSLGTFPASVGNPMIMYFYESVIRDMAESAGGSPYYIRNRVKEALVQDAVVETGEAVIDGQTVETQTVRLYPFADDPNQERMQGFGDLELSVTMSNDVPGWYLSLVAEAADGAVYSSELTFDSLADKQ